MITMAQILKGERGSSDQNMMICDICKQNVLTMRLSVPGENGKSSSVKSRIF